MTGSEAIAMLDRKLADHGQSVSLRRGPTGDVTTLAGFVRGYSPEELIGTITQSDRKVIVSPTGLGTFAPRRDDDVAISGKVGKVMEAEPVHIGTTLVRYNLQVRMA